MFVSKVIFKKKLEEPGDTPKSCIYLGHQKTRNAGLKQLLGRRERDRGKPVKPVGRHDGGGIRALEEKNNPKITEQCLLPRGAQITEPLEGSKALPNNRAPRPPIFHSHFLRNKNSVWLKNIC